jgi:hypothetical protein
MLAISGDVPVFVAAKAAMLVPEPLAARPMVVLSFVQLYVVPVPEKLIIELLVPLQTVWSETALTVGI